MTTKFKDTDRGWKKHGRTMKAAARGRPHVIVGIQGPEASDNHRVRIGKTETFKTSDQTNIEIGSTHEFGLGDMPERSFIRGSFDKNEAKYRRILNRLAGRVVAGKLKMKTALDTFGLQAHSDTIKFMTAGIDPAKIDGTTSRLKDTSDLHGSVTFVSKP